MHTFKDKKDQEWSMDLDLSKAMEIEGYDFSQAMGKELDQPHYIKFLNAEDALFQEILYDTRICYTFIWVLCKDQAAEHNIDDILEFAKRFDGETLDRARMALGGELINFFPRQKTTLTALIENISNTRSKVDERLGKLLDRKIPELVDKAMEEAEAELEKMDLLGRTSG